MTTPSLTLHESEVTQLCPTLCDPMDCSLPGSSIHGIVQARILEWVAIFFSRGSSQTRDQTEVSFIAGSRFTLWATREAPKYSRCSINICWMNEWMRMKRWWSKELWEINFICSHWEEPAPWRQNWTRDSALDPSLLGKPWTLVTDWLFHVLVGRQG